MTVDDLLDGSFLDESEDEDAGDLHQDQVGLKFCIMFATAYYHPGYVRAGIRW